MIKINLFSLKKKLACDYSLGVGAFGPTPLPAVITSKSGPHGVTHTGDPPAWGLS